MTIKAFTYKNCDTCKKATRFLAKMGVTYEEIPIAEKPPTSADLKKMLGYLTARGGTFKNLFNTSGQLYRELELSQRIKDGMTETQALALLAKNGKLVKRPFLLVEGNGTVGFKEAEWKELLEK